MNRHAHRQPRWLQEDIDSIEALLTLHPALGEQYRSFLATVETAGELPPRVLLLCRALIRQIHGCAPGEVTDAEALDLAAGRYDRFSAPEQAALVAAERMPYQHHQLLDEEVEAVKAAFGEAGCVALLTALAFFDVTCRLEATFRLGEK